ncbi:MAG: hypothetical protein HUU11_09400 [Anaerolineales bacterium]|nr:hypothetical protein [Anaerolineales bacterium]
MLYPWRFTDLEIRHLLEIVEALIVCNQRKTLSGLSRSAPSCGPSQSAGRFLSGKPVDGGPVLRRLVTEIENQP